MQAKSKTPEQLDGKDLMDVRDSGGQPMFHEVLPAFVTNTMFGILTVKLNEYLDNHPLSGVLHQWQSHRRAIQITLHTPADISPLFEGLTLNL